MHKGGTYMFNILGQQPLNFQVITGKHYIYDITKYNTTYHLLYQSNFTDI